MIQLDQWQKEVLEVKGDILLCTGRQIGKTYILARKACERMIEKKTKILIGSLTEDQAMLIITMMQDYMRERAPKMVSKGKDKPTLKTLTLTNGSEAISRPVGATGDGFRGYPADVLIPDEAARLPPTSWEAMKPTLLTTGGEIWMASTPFGKTGYFWEKFNEAYNLKLPEARFKVFHVTSEDVIRDRPISESWTEDQQKGALALLKEEKKDMSVLQYGQEYLGLFLEDLMQYFPDELIAKVLTGKRPALPIRNNIVMGVDLARLGGDEITYEFIQRRSDTSYQHVENIVRKGQTTDKTEIEITSLAEAWEADRVGIDAGSGAIGVGVYDRLMTHREMRFKVVAMNNRSISLNRDGTDKQRIFKEDMYDNLKNMMELGIITLLNDDNLRASMKSVQFEVDKDTGKFRIFGNYTHIVEGLVRAAWLSRKEKVNKFFIHYI